MNNSQVEKFRAFLALVPPTDWTTSLGSLRRELGQRDLGDIKWIAPEAIHLTLRFFGLLSAAEISEVIEKFSEVTVTFQPFTVGAGALGAFPDWRQPRIVWLGLEDSEKQLESLQTKIETATKSIGQMPEDRPFTPHLTMARIKKIDRPSAELLAGVAGTVKLQVNDWNISEIFVMRSHLSCRGARYEIMHKLMLAPRKALPVSR